MPIAATRVVLLVILIFVADPDANFTVSMRIGTIYKNANSPGEAGESGNRLYSPRMQSAF